MKRLRERRHADRHLHGAAVPARCSGWPQDDHVFFFMPHHIIWDGWSFDLLHQEISPIYGALVRGEPHGLPALPATHGDYADYAHWLEWTRPARRQLRFWKKRFANAPRPGTATDMPRRAGMSGSGGSTGSASTRT